jgi:CDGSH-type Zn-finger protein
MESAPIVNTVRVRENGPLAIHAPITLDNQPQGYRLTLCRCGASAHKPYCDGSHTAAGFTATGEPAPVESKVLEHRDGPLSITATADGSLHLVGNTELLTGTGKTIKRVTEAWLCRCGHSKNKPYCDGSHKAAGFRSGK